MFKQGDKYIHFTKYGGVNKGDVEWYGSTMNYDYENEVVYVSYYIKSTVGHIISIDGTDGRVYKINEEMDPETLRMLKNSTDVMDELKNRKSVNIEKPIEPLSESLVKKIKCAINYYFWGVFSTFVEERRL